MSDGEIELTYGELDERASRLAHFLLRLGAKPDALVGICLPRSAELVTASLGVLMSGAAYLPLDAANPVERSRQILASAGAAAVICTRGQAAALGVSGARAIVPDEAAPGEVSASAPVSRVRPDNLAYVIYTSGSTGAPKGVMISHRSLLNMIRWNRQRFELSPSDRVTMTASPGFDASVWEIWPALAAGASIHVPDEETRLSPHRLRDWLVARRITVSFAPTPLAELLLALRWPPGCRLRVLQTAGDRLHARPAPGLPFELVNNYGPAENTVVATSCTVGPDAGDLGLPPIGLPVGGVEAYLLDADLRMVAPGATGEVYLGGASLARGYLRQPGRTAERFVPSPDDRLGARLYRTGDLGRRRPDGLLEFCGRTDDQVKIRGNRVEPAEITAVLLTCPGIAAAFTAVHELLYGEKSLVAYLAPRSIRRMPSVAEVRRYLAGRLPGYMIPAEFVLLDSLPLTANGKVARQALPPPPGRRPAVSCLLPRSEYERRLAEIWSEVFARDRISVNESFFDLGGHSISAARLVARIRDRLGADISVATVFAHPTIAGLAKELLAAAPLEAPMAGGGSTALPPLRRAARLPHMPLSAAQEQVWFLTRLAPGTVAYHTQATIRVVGPLDTGVLERALTEIGRRHEIMHTVYGADGGRPWQAIRAPVPIPIAVADLRPLPARERDEQLERIIAGQMARPFDLSRLPLVRWMAVRLGPQEWELVLVEHHLVHDGWSFGCLMRELREMYRAFAAGEPSPLPALVLHYADFACWQRGALGSPGMKAQLAYWREQLAGLPPPPSIRTGQPRPRVMSQRGGRLRVELPPDLPEPLREFCRLHGLSLFAALLAAFAALLARETGTEDFCVGSALANRRFQELEPALGMFVNNVALRCDTSGNPSFAELAKRSQFVVLAAMANQDVPFSWVVKELKPPRSLSANPFFQFMFSFHDSPQPDLDFAGAPATVYEPHNGTAKVDLDVVVLPRAERQQPGSDHRDSRITMLWDYHLDVLDRVAAERLAGRYVDLLGAAVAAPDTPIAQLPCLRGE